MGDVLEASACVMKCANRFNTVGEAVGQEESLMTFTILRMVDAEITPYEFAKRAASAFFLWPKLLLDERSTGRCSRTLCSTISFTEIKAAGNLRLRAPTASAVVCLRFEPGT
ncbi:hypothetical protein [Caballeronia sordidicola]|uniref:Uncharacterized protein n=1 Tax=Caballeronia sordidicola TaxID=196367 RepID=A0A242M6G4_CABSO|nr:hypothetical protein [Caballeronia sordidicola]OTP66215.1 hypothetical protein PAMC26577_38135 [Caballeronia sordidicola]